MLESALSAAKERIAELESENARLRAEMERLLAALNWYSEKAEYLAKNDWKKKPEVAEAIFVEMSLDAGRRAQAAIKQAEEG